jgi:protein-S-isoprenylcysteine O-methyltransferase Ste14
MTPFVSKLIFVLMTVVWYGVRYEYARRSSRTPVVRSARGMRETVLLLISFSGLGLVPYLYIVTGVPGFAEQSFKPAIAWLGTVVAIVALVMFQLTHRALGQNWSVSLDVRADHFLITDGVYRKLRHPMYTAFWLWALAQALLLSNWVAGLSGLIGFGILFFGRVFREEQMMIETFGSNYLNYMTRTSRIIPLIY